MIRLATPEGILHVAERLRDEEVIVRIKGREAAKQHCLEVAIGSDWRWQLEIDGKPIALFGGDADPGDDQCSVWLFCTGQVSKRPLELFKGIRTCVEWGKKQWPSLVIEAEPRDQSQKRFLSLLGFSVRRALLVNGAMYEELVI